MLKHDKPLLLLGALPKKRNAVLTALESAEKLLDSVPFVKQEGDTAKPLRQIRAAIKQVNRSN